MKTTFVLDTAKLFKVLSNEVRLNIVVNLIKNELCVTELVNLVGVSQSSLSQHLAVLRKAKFVETRRKSQTIYYSVANNKLIKLISFLEELSNRRY